MTNQEAKQQLYSIGEFAQRARLTPKALRLYDSLGLLSPATVDPANGYRYYRNDQIDPPPSMRSNATGPNSRRCTTADAS